MNNLRVRARVVDVVNLTDQIYRLRLACDEFTTAQPGQFVNVSVPGFFLRRPLAIADIESNHDGSVILTVIVAKVGAGTRALADVVPGSEVEVLGPLGNGFDLDSIGQTPVLVGEVREYRRCTMLLKSSRLAADAHMFCWDFEALVIPIQLRNFASWDVRSV